MKTLVRPLFVVVLLLLVVGGHHVWAVDSYVSEVQKWRADYTRDLLGPDGPFTLVARLFPTRGMSSVGRDPANALVLPV